MRIQLVKTVHHLPDRDVRHAVMDGLQRRDHGVGVHLPGVRIHQLLVLHVRQAQPQAARVLRVRGVGLHHPVAVLAQQALLPVDLRRHRLQNAARFRLHRLPLLLRRLHQHVVQPVLRAQVVLQLLRDLARGVDLQPVPPVKLLHAANAPHVEGQQLLERPAAMEVQRRQPLLKLLKREEHRLAEYLRAQKLSHRCLGLVHPHLRRQLVLELLHWLLQHCTVMLGLEEVVKVADVALHGVAKNRYNLGRAGFKL
mmetsp:Transcript_38171/g.95917  ORF Transcript_38171/g.95917 Transcript_38171/m.95917 type:complete len:254 (+) Transcript_38171:124-885(+)